MSPAEYKRNQLPQEDYCLLNPCADSSASTNLIAPRLYLRTSSKSPGNCFITAAWISRHFQRRASRLVHTRLSLLDLSERSRQPFWDDQGRYALAYNGEIYNFKELRAQLERQNVTFRTTSDTEVLLQMLIHRGFDQTLAVVEGMYAFAFYDRHTHTLTLARDRFGIKPLYVCHHNGAFLFSSSIAAFRPWLTFEPDLLSIVDYLQGSGGPHAGHSFYKGIHIVEPGAVIAVSADGTVSSRYHFRLGDLWDADLAEELAGLSPRQVVDRTSKCFSKA